MILQRTESVEHGGSVRDPRYPQKWTVLWMSEWNGSQIGSRTFFVFLVRVLIVAVPRLEADGVLLVVVVMLAWQDSSLLS